MSLITVFYGGESASGKGKGKGKKKQLMSFLSKSSNPSSGNIADSFFSAGKSPDYGVRKSPDYGGGKTGRFSDYGSILSSMGANQIGSSPMARLPPKTSTDSDKMWK